MRESVIYQSILKEGREEGLKQGLKQGQEEAIQRIVTNMLDKGVSVELIV